MEEVTEYVKSRIKALKELTKDEYVFTHLGQDINIALTELEEVLRQLTAYNKIK